MDELRPQLDDFNDLHASFESDSAWSTVSKFLHGRSTCAVIAVATLVVIGLACYRVVEAWPLALIVGLVVGFGAFAMIYVKEKDSPHEPGDEPPGS